MELMELLRTRRTYRRFRQEPVPDAVLTEMLEAARIASSAANRQPLKYLVVRDPEKVEMVFAETKWAGYLPPEEGTPKEGERPVLFVAVLADEEITSASAVSFDAGLAVSNMTLAAWNHGVGSCIIGACNRPKLSEYFGLPPKLVILDLVAFGYPSHTSACEEMTGSVKYYLDEERNYHVPKRPLEEIVRYF